MNSQIGAAAGAHFSTPYKIYVLLLLTLVYISNYADRQLISVLTPFIQKEFGLGDGAMGLLSGATFAIFYASLGIPIAIYADRANRSHIIVASVVVWSVMTAFCGAARNFWEFAAARVGVGIGEAGSSPPSHSIIADMFSTKARTTALAIYSLGVPFGIVAAYNIGGQIAAHPEWTWPPDFGALFGGVPSPDAVPNPNAGWRWAYVILGLPGVLLGLLVLATVREPRRGMSDGVTLSGEAPAVMTVVRHIMATPALVHVFIAATLVTITGYAGVQWWPKFLIVSHGLTPQELGFIPGWIFGVASGLGVFASGVLTDGLARLDPRWMPRTVGLTILAVLPFGAGLYLVGDLTTPLFHAILGDPSDPAVDMARNRALLYGLLGISAFAGGFYLAPTFAITQTLVGVRMRTLASALLLFVINIIGYTFGPAISGYFSDYLQTVLPAEEIRHSLKYSLLAMTVFNVWAVYHYWRAGNFYTADLERQRALNLAASQ